MVSSCSCGCNTTSTAPTHGNGTTSYSSNQTCSCWNGYDCIPITNTYTADLPEILLEAVSFQFSSGTIITIFYVVFLLQHYVEPVARAPPSGTRCFDVNKGLEPCLDSWCFQEPPLPSGRG